MDELKLLESCVDREGYKCTEERSATQILANIRKWAEDMPYFLSNAPGYARGYREGMYRAHKIVMSIITGKPLED